MYQCHILISKIFFSSDICQLGATCHHAYLLTSDELYWQLQVQGCIFSQNILFWTQIFFNPKFYFTQNFFVGLKLFPDQKFCWTPKLRENLTWLGKMAFHLGIWVISPSHSKNLLALVKIQILEPSGRVLPKQLHLCPFGFIIFRFVSAQIWKNIFKICLLDGSRSRQS